MWLLLLLCQTSFLLDKYELLLSVAVNIKGYCILKFLIFPHFDLNVCNCGVKSGRVHLVPAESFLLK
jgi:hypothetical protein